MSHIQPRVLNVIGSLATGGAESLLYYLHRHLKSDGYDNFAICTLTNEGQFYRKMKEDNLPVICLGLSSRRDPRVVARLVRVIREGHFNIVHSHLGAAYFYSVIASLFLPNVRFVYTVHGIDPGDCGSPLKRMLYRVLGMKTDRIVAVSEATKKEYLKLTSIPERKVSIIQNAIETSEFDRQTDTVRKRTELGIEQGVCILLAVGSMCQQKGYDTLLRALKLLKGRQKTHRLLIAGDGVLRDEMEKMRDALGLQDEVLFLGKRSDVPELLHLADIFVSSSNSEGMPISIIEAMICGKPIVATAVDGTCELIRSGIDGMLVPPGDPPALASAIAELMDDPLLATQSGANARRRAFENFSMPVMVGRMLALYLSLLDGR